MFYKNNLATKKSEEKVFEFDMFGLTQNTKEDETTLEVDIMKIKEINYIEI